MECDHLCVWGYLSSSARKRIFPKDIFFSWVCDFVLLCDRNTHVVLVVSVIFFFFRIFMRTEKTFSESISISAPFVILFYFFYFLFFCYFYVHGKYFFRNHINFSSVCDFVLFYFFILFFFFFFCSLPTITLENPNQSKPNFHTWLLSKKLRRGSKMVIAGHM